MELHVEIVYLHDCGDSPGMVSSQIIRGVEVGEHFCILENHRDRLKAHSGTPK